MRITRVRLGRGCLLTAKVPRGEDLEKTCVLFFLGVAIASGWNFRHDYKKTYSITINVPTQQTSHVRRDIPFESRVHKWQCERNFVTV